MTDRTQHTKKAARLSLQEIRATLKRWNSQVDKLMKQEGGVLVKSTSTRFDYQFPEISYLKGVEYNTDNDRNGGVGFAFYVKTKPKNYGIGNQFDPSTGRAIRSFDDPIYLWDDDAEERFGEMLQQMRREIQKIRTYSEGLGVKRKGSVSAQQHRMAMELIGASDLWALAPPQYLKALKALEKVFTKSKGVIHTYDNQGRRFAGFRVEFKDPVLLAFHCHQLQEGDPFICEFKVEDPASRDAYSQYGTVYDPKTRKVTLGTFRMDLGNDGEVLQLLKRVQDFIKGANMVSKIFLREGVSGLLKRER